MWLVFVVSLLTVLRSEIVRSQQCPFPGIPANAVALNERNETVDYKTSSSFKTGQSVRYFCWRFKMNPGKFQSQIKCRENGTWSAPLPKCKRQVNFDHVTYEESATYHKFSYQCNISARKFYVENANVRRNENIVVSVSTCDGTKDSTVGYGFRNSTYNAITRCVNVTAPNGENNESTWFRCQLNMTRHGEKFYIFLGKGGSIKSIGVFAEGDHCGFPPVPVHGKFNEDEWKPGSTSVEYECQDEFQIFGNRNNTCDPSTGTWGPLPHCLCPLPKLSPFLNVTLHNHTSVKFSCPEHLELKGSDGQQSYISATCNESSRIWTPAQPPTCHCPVPVEDHFHCSSVNETSCEYQCSESLSLSGHGFLTCNQSSGAWSQPSCQCEIPTIRNGIARGDGETFHFECNAGFVLSGNSTATCYSTNGIGTERLRCTLSNVLIISASFSLILLAAITIAIVLAWKKKMWCWSKRDVGSLIRKANVKVDQKSTEGLYVNIIELKVRQEPVYVELGLKNRPEGHFPKTETEEPLYSSVDDSDIYAIQPRTAEYCTRHQDYDQDSVVYAKIQGSFLGY